MAGQEHKIHSQMTVLLKSTHAIIIQTFNADLFLWECYLPGCYANVLSSIFSKSLTEDNIGIMTVF